MGSLLRTTLPRLPRRMQSLNIDTRGYPVPWFVKWFNGTPDFRVIDGERFRQALRFGLCWVCGEQLGVHKTFVVGPMCTVTRITSEPPCHWDCAEYAVRACPFMLLPAAKRREALLPDGVKPPPGDHSPRNPGVMALWTTRAFKIMRRPDGELMQFGEPVSVEWFTQGAYATRAQVLASLDDGLPFLYKNVRMAIDYIQETVKLENDYARVLTHLPDQL